MRRLGNFASLFAAFALLAPLSACTKPYVRDGNAWLIEAPDRGKTLRVSFYGNSIVRLQTAWDGEAFLPDGHYRMVVSHDRQSDVEVLHSEAVITFRTPELQVSIDPETLTASFLYDEDDLPVLYERAGEKDGDLRRVRFGGHSREHFTGLGHGFFGRADSLDLSGQVIERNYGREQIEQAPLIVPFYMSSRGYGVFLNSTFPNRFAFTDDDYSMAIDTHGFDGQMDYFFIAGPTLPDVLDHYTLLTGRPRLPPKSIFGLQLSDKGHDHTSETPSDEAWWKQKITAHREAGLPLDHVVNDNRWRAGGGQRCVSRLEWDAERFPDPEAWATWLEDNGLTTTLDFNRCIARFSEGWRDEFNLPLPIDKPIDVDFADSAPDLTNPKFRQWFWELFYTQSLDPALNYPGDALWIDEFDEQGAMALDTELANGRSSAEMRNYWFFLIAEALVADGWNRSDIDKRPYVWVRGMTAGAQRYATLWSGDIKPNHDDMRAQVIAMQLAGLSGFPYWGHDAGGFFDWDEQAGPDDNLYMRWALAFGSFAPIWKPHGMGESRWPLDREEDNTQRAARKFGRLRYELMPYLYTAAHEAAETGMPMARALFLHYPELDGAWEHNQQYFWGPDILVAPNASHENAIRVWLPPGRWYRYGTNVVQTDQDNEDGKVWSSAAPWQIPLYVREGAIIPRREYAGSTFFIDKSTLYLDVYAGADGTGRLVEDDDVTEAYRRGERRVTTFNYDDTSGVLTVGAAEGSFSGAPPSRTIVVTVYNGEDELGAEPRRFRFDDVPVDQALTVDMRQ